LLSLFLRNHERSTNEAKALELISQRTKIPVPKLLGHGQHPDGRRYLITELTDGVPLSDFRDRGCSNPNEETHTDSTQQCTRCADQAYEHALKFIQVTVLPQLKGLRSRQRGIDGFVMPPSWLSLNQPPWKGKSSWKTLLLETDEYVFQHGDIAAQNILMDP
jgi:serine/threonine protein kinase